jgi:two-component system response regulator RegA
MTANLPEVSSENPHLLLVDDDQTFCMVLAQALSKRKFEVFVAHDLESALELADRADPEYAVIDLRIGHESGLMLVKRLKELDDNTRIVVLTGFASVATAVEAIKLGATHYLSKPADADEIVAALHKDAGDTNVEIKDKPLSVKRLEWEHLQKILVEHDHNISAAARALGMHRRTLQRKLEKRPVKE